MKKLSIILDRI